MPKEKIWNIIPREDKADINEIAKGLGISYPTASLLYHRGYKTSSEAASFIRLEDELFHDPFLLTDMEKAANRIVSAIDGGEKIVIYGDYDVDGVTSVSLLCLYLREKGASVSYYIPNRVGEGYGVNREALRSLYDQGNSLFITVDTGITAHEEAAYCKELGCDLIITDHHECQDVLPDGYAVIDPHRPCDVYPFKELAGVGVAFKVAVAVEFLLKKRLGEIPEGFLTEIVKKYIDLVALGTIADVMPLHDENRLIVSMGLSLMENRPRVGLKALLDACDSGKSTKKRKINSSLIGFTVAPRINAAGRISSASIAAELFLTEDIDKARAIASELCEINVHRQAEENKIADEIKERIEKDPELRCSPVIVLENEGWNHGVIGIVASRITEKYGRPSILISFEDGVGKGSGRSIKGLNLASALSYCSDLLIKCGGHELAAGLTIEEDKLEAFKRRINEYALSQLGTSDPISSLDIDMELFPSEMTLDLALELELLEPYGISNPVPTFVCSELTVNDVVGMGQNRHTKLILEGQGSRFPAVYFGISPSELGISSGDRVDVAFRLGINEFQGTRSAQVLVRDIRFSDASKEDNEKNHNDYLSASDGASHVRAEWIPKRQDFVSVYLHLKRSLPSEGDTVFVRALLHTLNETSQEGARMNYVKLRIILDVLSEMGIIVLSEMNGCPRGHESFNIKIPSLQTKVDLEKSCIYSKLTRSNRTTLTE